MVRGPLHGIARYALELARRLPALAPTWQFEGLVGPEGVGDDLGELTPRIPLRRCAAGFLSPLEQPALAAALVSARPDLFHATSFSLPALWPGPLVATLHDATHLALEQHASATQRAYYALVVGPRARRAQALLTVSEFSRNEIARVLELPRDALEVISNGVDQLFCPPHQREIEDFRSRRGLPVQYFAAVGNPKPHKNLGLLVPIADRLPARLALLAGRGARRALGLPESVLELAPLPDTDLPLFYAGASAVLIPSRHEGFGLPALEALACGATVLAADAGAHPEVLGDAAALLPPGDPEAWLAATRRVLDEPAWARELAARGPARAARFTWDECARRTLAVYQRALPWG